MAADRLTSGEQIAQTLASAGIDTIFALTGGHNSPILEACDDVGITVVAARDERHAGLMAATWGTLNQKPGVCVVTAGPGHTNAYSAFAHAQEGNHPMLSISGMYEQDAEGKGALQEVAQVEMADTVSKWAQGIRDPDKVVQHTEEALLRANTPPRGHSHLSVHFDVLGATRDETAIDFADPAEYLQRYDRAADAGRVQDALAALSSAERPVAILGGDAWFSNPGDEIREFVERTQIPVFTQEKSRGLIPDSHDLCFGGTTLRISGASREIQESDCVLLLDTYVDWRLDYGKPPALPPADEATFVHVDETGERLGVRLTPDVGIVADARNTLEQLAAGADDYEWSRPTAWIDHLTEADEEFQASYESGLTSTETPIHLARVGREVADALDPETRIVFGGGLCGKWAKFSATAERPGRWIRHKGPFGLMGYGLPAAVAAQLTAPEDDVVLFTGDGSFGYNVMEIETAVEYDLPITIVVANNSAWGSVGGEDEPIATQLPTTAYHEMAESLGAHGELITEPGEVQPAVERAREMDVPALVNVIADDAVPPYSLPDSLRDAY